MILFLVDYNGVFSIDHDNGKLYVNGALFVTGSLHCCDVPHDYSSCNCTLRVTAKDQGIPSKEAEADIIIIPYDPNNPTQHIHNPSSHAHHTGKHHVTEQFYHAYNNSKGGGKIGEEKGK